MRVLILCLALMPGSMTCLFAQKKPSPDVIYYDADWKVCYEYQAHYYGFKLKTDSGHKREDFYRATNKPQMIAFFDDEDEKVPHGALGTFYPSGQLQKIQHYHHGTRQGPVVGYHPNGMISDSAFYKNDMPLGYIYSWHSNGYMKDSTRMLNDTLGVQVQWFDNGIPAASGYVANGEKHGTWQYFNQEGSLVKKAKYSQGKAFEETYYDKQGNVTTEFDRDAEPYYGNRLDDWSKYMDKALYWPLDLEFTENRVATVEVSFVVGTDGKVYDAYVSLPLHKEFDEIALKAVTQSKLWKPAIQDNRPIAKRFRQAVNFSQKER